MSQKLHAAVADFKAWLSQTFAEEQPRDQEAFERATQIFKKRITSSRAGRPGRPRKKIVTLATEMRRQGKSWPQIYAVCLPSDMEGAERNMAQLQLRSAERGRRVRERPVNQGMPVSEPGR